MFHRMEPFRSHHASMPTRQKLLFVLLALFVLLVSTEAVSVTAAPLPQSNPDCFTMESAFVVVLDTDAQGRFFRSNADGDQISGTFTSTEVWITGNLSGKVTVQISASAAEELKGNNPLSIVNRTGNAICINLDLDPAIAVLSTEVSIDGDLLHIGQNAFDQIRIDLSTVDTLTLNQQMIDLRDLEVIIHDGIVMGHGGMPPPADEPTVPGICGAISPDLEGATLISVLNSIASTDQSPLTYSQVREALRETDRDPDNLDNVLLFYTNRSQDIFTFASDSTSLPDADRWNREHLWPQSHGAEEHENARTDLHHIRATDVSINSSRSNQDFGEVDEVPANEVIDNPNGATVADTWDDNHLWEPRDAIKGDIARALFYMDVRYQGDNDEPDLRLVPGDTPDGSGQVELGDLTALLAWHAADPVSPEEIARHNAAVAIQGNINPFIACAAQIDVSKIWGGG